MKKALVSAIMTVALASCSGSVSKQGGPTSTEPFKTEATVAVATVTETATVQAVPNACRQALSTARVLIRRAEYYPLLVYHAAFAEQIPRRLLREAHSLERELANLNKTFTRARSRCLD